MTVCINLEMISRFDLHASALTEHVLESNLVACFLYKSCLLGLMAEILKNILKACPWIDRTMGK